MQLLQAIHRARQIIDARYELGAPITATQLIVLRSASDNPGCSQTDLVRATGIDRSTLADIVRRLVNNGLLARRRDRRDARAYVVTITDKGKTAMNDALKYAAETERFVFTRLSASEGKALMAALNKIAAPEEVAELERV